MYTPIEVTPQNLHSAINENLRLIAEELAFKFPIRGNVELLGDLDFQGLYTILGVQTNGQHSAASPQRAVLNDE